MANILVRILKTPVFIRSTEIYNRLFGRYLFVTNTISYVALYGLGDVLIQYIERHALRKENDNRGHDFRRTLSFMAFASFHGPVNHFWYSALDRFIKGSKHSNVFKKLIADQLIFAPYSTGIFFMGLGTIEGQSLKTSVEETKRKFIPTYLADLAIWPAAQILNFYVVPPHLRMMYINTVTLFWNTFLSYMKHKDQLYCKASSEN
eukprot:gene8066-8929_t